MPEEKHLPFYNERCSRCMVFAHHHSSSLIDQHSALLVTFLLPLQEQRFSYQTRPSCHQTLRLRKRADYRVDSLRSLHGRLARHPTGSSVPGRPSFSSSHHASHGKITACFRVSVPDIQAESDLIVPLFGLSVNGFFYNPQPTGSPFLQPVCHVKTGLRPGLLALWLVCRQRIQPLDVTRRRNQH